MVDLHIQTYFRASDRYILSSSMEETSDTEATIIVPHAIVWRLSIAIDVVSSYSNYVLGLRINFAKKTGLLEEIRSLPCAVSLLKGSVTHFRPSDRYTTSSSMEQIIDTEARIIVPLAIVWGLPTAIDSYNKVCKKRTVCSNVSVAFMSELLCFCQEVFPNCRERKGNPAPERTHFRPSDRYTTSSSMEQIIDTEARIIVPLAIGWGLPNAIAAVSALFTLCFKSYNKVCKKRRVCSNTSIAFISGLLCFCQKVFPTFKRERNKSRALEVFPSSIQDPHSWLPG
ncbi:hypothetical protein PSTT_14355, partial [Puccinia striiformis]